MNKREIYDAVFVYETNFQKKIVESIVSKYNNSKIEFIDARFHKIIFKNKCYNINLNGVRNTINSIKDLRNFPKIKTNKLFCTALTGINSRFFEAVIDYNSLSIFDDGIGTPVILIDKKYLKTLNLCVRFWFSFIVLFLLNQKKLSLTKNLISKIEFYYTIYPYYSYKYNQRLKIIPIIFFERKNSVIIDDYIGFIGSSDYLNRNSKIEFIYNKFKKKIIYYAHLMESIDNLNMEYISKVIIPETTIEDYFKKNGVPSILVGDISTVFLNVKLIYGDFPLLYVFYKENKKLSTYYMLLKDNGVNLILNNNI